MTIKNTSLATYFKLKDSGQLGKQQRRILNVMSPEYIFQHMFFNLFYRLWKCLYRIKLTNY
jgi:hypothetical protein